MIRYSEMGFLCKYGKFEFPATCIRDSFESTEHMNLLEMIRTVSNKSVNENIYSPRAVRDFFVKMGFLCLKRD